MFYNVLHIGAQRNCGLTICSLTQAAKSSQRKAAVIFSLFFLKGRKRKI